MTNLNFADRLITNTFANNNNYVYSNLKPTNLRFYVGCPNLPYILCNAWHSDQTVLMYSFNTYQLRNRLLNTARIKEVMDSAHIPIMISLKGKWYMMGKGFLAHVNNFSNADFGESLNLLFVACVDASEVTVDLIDVKFFVSRDIYKEDYKAVLPAVKDFMVGHKGDVILTNNISDRVGDKIPFPPGGTLEDRNDYKKKVVLECIKGCFK